VQRARSEMRVLKPDEARRFLDQAAKTKHGVLFDLALTTSLRPSEYLVLRWSDINWQDETVTVSRTLEKGSGWKFASTKRARSRRVVKLQGWAASRLRKFDTLDTARPSSSPDAVRQILKTRYGRPINSDYLARRFKHLLSSPPRCRSRRSQRAGRDAHPAHPRLIPGLSSCTKKEHHGSPIPDEGDEPWCIISRVIQSLFTVQR
jgi:integrase